MGSLINIDKTSRCINVFTVLKTSSRAIGVARDSSRARESGPREIGAGANHYLDRGGGLIGETSEVGRVGNDVFILEVSASDVNASVATREAVHAREGIGRDGQASHNDADCESLHLDGRVERSAVRRYWIEVLDESNAGRTTRGNEKC